MTNEAMKGSTGNWICIACHNRVYVEPKRSFVLGFPMWNCPDCKTTIKHPYKKSSRIFMWIVLGISLFFVISPFFAIPAYNDYASQAGGEIINMTYSQIVWKGLWFWWVLVILLSYAAIKNYLIQKDINVIHEKIISTKTPNSTDMTLLMLECPIPARQKVHRIYALIRSGLTFVVTYVLFVFVSMILISRPLHSSGISNIHGIENVPIRILAYIFAFGFPAVISFLQARKRYHRYDTNPIDSRHEETEPSQPLKIIEESGGLEGDELLGARINLEQKCKTARRNGIIITILSLSIMLFAYSSVFIMIISGIFFIIGLRLLYNAYSGSKLLK